MNQPRNKVFRIFCRCGLGLLILISSMLLLVPHLTVYKWVFVSGPSVHVRLGLLSPDISSLTVGDYVLLTWRSEGPEPNGITRLKPGLKLIKRVGCLSGHQLRITDGGVECDGKYIGHIRHQSMNGTFLTPYYFDGPVPEGQVFLLGDHFFSYDSRYFGPVPLQWLHGVLAYWI